MCECQSHWFAGCLSVPGSWPNGSPQKFLARKSSRRMYFTLVPRLLNYLSNLSSLIYGHYANVPSYLLLLAFGCIFSSLLFSARLANKEVFDLTRRKRRARIIPKVLSRCCFQCLFCTSRNTSTRTSLPNPFYYSHLYPNYDFHHSHCGTFICL